MTIFSTLFNKFKQKVNLQVDIMRIHRIFELLKDKIWAVQYEGEDAHVIDQLKENWTDAQWLQEFFEQQKQDLQSGFYGDITVDDAALITIDEADELFDALEEDEGKHLNSLFQPLDDREFRIKHFQKQKAKGAEYRTWLRIYAIRYFDGYVITGGTIKLTKQMQGKAHTELELKKLRIVRDALKFNTIADKFIDLD